MEFIIKSNVSMRDSKKKQVVLLQDPENSLDSFYEPLGSESQHRKGASRSYGDHFCVNLFSDGQVAPHVMKQVTLNQLQEDSAKTRKDPVLSKIFGNTKNPKKAKSKNNEENQQANFCFNNKIKVAYPQTPGFKSLLQSPFGKFNNIHRDLIDCLSRQKDPRLNFEPVSLDANPLDFFNKSTNSFSAAKYFIGIAMSLKELDCISQSLFLCNLACYADPYNQKAWKKYISMIEEQGDLSKAFVISKTAFLFTQTEDTAKSYLVNGEKCGATVRELQGLLSSVSNPEALERNVLPESAKLQIKYGQAWKGIKVLWQVCKNYDFKLAVCSIILFTAKYLENLGYVEEALKLLRRSFSKSMTKLQIYTMYLEMAIRNKDHLDEEDMQEVLRHAEFISGENRYRLYLQLAQIMYKSGDRRFYDFVQLSYQSAMDYCAPGAGTSKAFKQIYFTVAKLKGIPPTVKSENDHVIFEKNRYNFICDMPFIEHEFSDWKYYLHYGVIKKHELLSLASKKWPLTGRLIAEWIHCLRATKQPLQMLKLWRQKIDDVPKSGELWCEGGRIFAELGEWKNASKCFKYAIHFTPQYGDSFIEELRILLKESRFLEIEKLKKIFLVSQPFYGHVLSYLRLNHWSTGKLSMNQMWENARKQISNELYRPGCERGKLLTSYAAYDKAYLQPTERVEKERLFASYEQMENKN